MISVIHCSMFLSSTAFLLSHQQNKRKLIKTIQSILMPEGTAVNYVNYCTRAGVPPPPVSTREQEHLSSCNECQVLWPLFYQYQYPNNGSEHRTLEQMAFEWSNLTEKSRTLLLGTLLRVEAKVVRSLTKRRVHTAYQLFTKETLIAHAPRLMGYTFGEKSKHVAGLWKRAEDTTKHKYRALSHAAKLARELRLSTLPRHNQIRQTTPSTPTEKKGAANTSKFVRIVSECAVAGGKDKTATATYDIQNPDVFPRAPMATNDGGATDDTCTSSVMSCCFVDAIDVS
jgi:hypothetical protein